MEVLRTAPTKLSFSINALLGTEMKEEISDPVEQTGECVIPKEGFCKI